jgi:hypothetical protein
MRGWIIVDSLMVLGGFVSNAFFGESSSVGSSLCALGVTLLTLTLAARLVRGRA